MISGEAFSKLVDALVVPAINEGNAATRKDGGKVLGHFDEILSSGRDLKVLFDKDLPAIIFLTTRRDLIPISGGDRRRESLAADERP